MDSSERPPVENKPIFQPGSKRCYCMDTESDNEEEDEDQELQAEMFDPNSFYKHSKKLKLPQSIEHYVNTHFTPACLTVSGRRWQLTIPSLTFQLLPHP